MSIQWEKFILNPRWKDSSGAAGMFFLAIVMCVMCFSSLSIGTGTQSTDKKFEIPAVSRQPLLVDETESGFGII